MLFHSFSSVEGKAPLPIPLLSTTVPPPRRPHTFPPAAALRTSRHLFLAGELEEGI